MGELPAVILTPRLPWKRGAEGECAIIVVTTRPEEIANNVRRAFIGTHQHPSVTQTCAFVSGLIYIHSMQDWMRGANVLTNGVLGISLQFDPHTSKAYFMCF